MGMGMAHRKLFLSGGGKEAMMAVSGGSDTRLVLTSGWSPPAAIALLWAAGGPQQSPAAG